MWTVLVQDWYYEISSLKKKCFYFISPIRSPGGNSICAWPFQGSAGGLDGCLPDHLLQPLLHERNQGGLGSQSNVEYWKGYSSAHATSCPGPQWLLTSGRLIPMTEFVIRSDEAEVWMLPFWQWSDRRWLNMEVPPSHHHPSFCYCTACL